MRNLKNKIAIALLMVGMLLGYTHCGVPGAGGETKSSLQFGHIQAPNAGGNASESNSGANVVVFSTTIWPITKNNCFSCHGASQQPLHASNDVNKAFGGAISNQKVDIGNSESSRLYLKLKDERHNCWSDCDSNAAEMLTAINSYISGVESSSSGDNTQELETASKGPLTSLLNQENQLLFTADQFMLQSPFVQKLDGVEYYFENQNNNGQRLNSNSANAGRAFKNFNVPASADYNVWALVKAPSGGDDSFFVKIDNSKYYEWHIPQTTGFEWRKLTDLTARNPVKVSIDSTMTNRLEISQREDGTALKKVFITEDDDFDPSAGSFSSFAEVSYDISSLVGQGQGTAQFKFSIRSFDEYTYEVSNLRIVSQVRLKVKAPKILVNGRYSSQHNTYNYVETITDLGETTIANYSMLVLKDSGDDVDIFAWTFDELELE